MFFQNDNYFILTGAPGVGKTTLRFELEKASIKCISEPARIVLAEQRAKQSEALPEKNKNLFCEMLLQRSMHDHEAYRNYDGPVVFDRGVPDSIAYAGCFNLNTATYFAEAKKYSYNKTVFLLAPWEEIYTTDDERRMTFDQVLEFHKLICGAYGNLGYNLVEVPRGTIQDRANFVKSMCLKNVSRGQK